MLHDNSSIYHIQATLLEAKYKYRPVPSVGPIKIVKQEHNKNNLWHGVMV